jgi:tetratricopeptide (TPR) repeat protein
VERVFLSYRRSDSDYALLLYEFLKQNFGRDRVFLDTDYIEPGENFVKTLERELESSAAFIALIGRGWTDSLSRLSEARDYVRMELAWVLGRNGLVVPVLAGGAKMPSADDLPVELASLPQLSAVEVRVHGDLEALVRVIRKVMPEQRPAEQELTAQQRRVLDLLRRQVSRVQVRAVELIEAGQIDRAFDELNEGIEVVLCLQEWSPAAVSVTLLLGYIYKTLAQAFLASGHQQQADQYFDLAASVFETAKTTTAQEQYSSDELASAINGLANIQYYRGELDAAIENYKLAVKIVPGYAYAWHDLFLAYVERAKQGKPDLAGMREALENTRRTGQGIPGLGEKSLQQLDQLLRYWEQQPAATGKPRRGKGRR